MFNVEQKRKRVLGPRRVACKMKWETRNNNNAFLLCFGPVFICDWRRGRVVVVDEMEKQESEQKIMIG